MRFLTLLVFCLLLLLVGCGNDSAERLGRARALYDEGRPREAREVALELVEGASLDEETSVGLAMLLVEVGEARQAIALLKGMEELSPHGKDALGWAYLAAGDRIHAGILVDELIKRSEDTGRTRFLKGLIALRGRRMEQARRELEESIRRDDSDPASWAALAGALAAAGDEDGAMKLLRETRGRFPDSPEIRKAMASLLFGAGSAEAFGQVVELLRPVAERFPLDRSARAMLATALKRLLRWMEAEQEWQKLSDEWPDVAGYWSELGIARIERGRNEEAVRALEKAADLAPLDIPILKNLGNGYLAVARSFADHKPLVREARKVFERLLVLAPNDPSCYVGLARCEVKMDPEKNPGPEEAIFLYEKALTLDPGFFPALLNLALLYYDLWISEENPHGEGYRKAKELFDRAARITPPERWDPRAREAYEGLR